MTTGIQKGRSTSHELVIFPHTRSSVFPGRRAYRSRHRRVAEETRFPGKQKAIVLSSLLSVGHMKNDCWWNESVKPVREASSLEPSTVSAASTTSKPPITGMLPQSDDAEVLMADSAQLVCSVARQNLVRNADSLIDSGAATSVCQQSLADSVGGKPT